MQELTNKGHLALLSRVYTYYYTLDSILNTDKTVPVLYMKRTHGTVGDYILHHRKSSGVESLSGLYGILNYLHNIFFNLSKPGLISNLTATDVTIRAKISAYIDILNTCDERPRGSVLVLQYESVDLWAELSLWEDFGMNCRDVLRVGETAVLPYVQNRYNYLKRKDMIY